MKRVLQFVTAIVLFGLFIAVAALYDKGGAAGRDEALSAIRNHVGRVSGAGDEARYRLEEQKLKMAENWALADRETQGRVCGRVKGALRVDAQPAEWKADPKNMARYGTLYQINVKDTGNERANPAQDDIVLVASRENLAAGSYLFALYELVDTNNCILALTPQYTRVFTKERFREELGRKSFDYLLNTQFDALVLAKFHELFPNVVAGSEKEAGIYEKVRAYAGDRSHFPVVAGCFLLAVLLALWFGPRLSGRGSGKTEKRKDAERCPYCGEPLEDDTCPRGHTIVRCAKCGAIMKDGVCPNGCTTEPPPDVELCPYHNEPLINGECPHGCTINRCAKCGAIMKDGECPNGCTGELPATEEVCPYHNEPLINGECPHGCTIVRCAQCGAIMKDGICPNCNGDREVCPSCGSDILPDGSCPNGCTVIRCTECGAIMREGECPKGCTSNPLHFGWGGAEKPEMTDFALEVVTPEEYAGFIIDVPADFVVGRSAINAREPFLELLVRDNAKKQECSRRYVQFALEDDDDCFTVTLLKTSGNSAVVNDRKLSREGETERLYEGETIRLRPDFELKLVRKS